MVKKTAKLKNKEANMSVASVIMVAVFCLTLVNQGGFYEGAIAFAGILLTVFLFPKRINLKISLLSQLHRFAHIIPGSICSSSSNDLY